MPITVPNSPTPPPDPDDTFVYPRPADVSDAAWARIVEQGRAFLDAETDRGASPAAAPFDCPSWCRRHTDPEQDAPAHVGSVTVCGFTLDVEQPLEGPGRIFLPDDLVDDPVLSSQDALRLVPALVAAALAVSGGASWTL